MGEGSQHSGVGLGLRGNQGLGMGGKEEREREKGKDFGPPFYLGSLLPARRWHKEKEGGDISSFTPRWRKGN